MEISVILFINSHRNAAKQQIIGWFYSKYSSSEISPGPECRPMPTISTLFIGCQSLAPGPSNGNRNVPRLLKTNPETKQALLG